MGRKVSVWYKERYFLNLLKPFDKYSFEISPAIVNAFYSHEQNSISNAYFLILLYLNVGLTDFPAAILQPPAYSGDFPKSEVKMISVKLNIYINTVNTMCL